MNNGRWTRAAVAMTERARARPGTWTHQAAPDAETAQHARGAARIGAEDVLMTVVVALATVFAWLLFTGA